MSITPTRQHPTGWSDMPDELKVIILEYYLTFPKVVTAKNHQIFHNMRLQPLLQAKIGHLSQIATQAFYKQNTFGMVTIDFYNGLCPPVSSSRNIQRLELTITRLPHALFEHSVSFQRALSNRAQNMNDMRSTGEERRIAVENWRSLWQIQFPRLRSLRLIFKIAKVGIDEPAVDDDCLNRPLSAYVVVLESAIALIEVEKLTVTLICDSFCVLKKPGHESGGCECVKQLEDGTAADILGVNIVVITSQAGEASVE